MNYTPADSTPLDETSTYRLYFQSVANHAQAEKVLNSRGHSTAEVPSLRRHVDVCIRPRPVPAPRRKRGYSR